MTERVRVGVIFGGRSVEHEVSVVTAMQAMAALPPDRFTAVPVYIAKSGRWYTGGHLRSVEAFQDVDRVVEGATGVVLPPQPGQVHQLVELGGRRGLLGGPARSIEFDVALPLVHGTHGEDGTLQGLFELADIPYTGCGVAAAAISMDKQLTKAVLRAAGLPVLDAVYITRQHWRADADAVCAEIVSRFAPPLFVKPMTLGSSIGVARAQTNDELRGALETALVYDARCLVEPAQEGITEINCAVLGRGSDLQFSVCEQPVASGVLSYADKYLNKGGSKEATTGMKGARRVIPAPIEPALTQRIQQAALDAFRAIGAEGVARVDFLVRPENDWFVVNELNTIPGSLAFYLWEPAGVPFDSLLSRLIEMALQRHAEKRETTYSIDSWLLRGRPKA